MADIDKSLSSITLTKAYEESEAELKNHLPPWAESNFKQKIHISFLYTLICMPVLVLFTVIIGGYSVYVCLYVLRLLGSADDTPELYYYHSESEKTNARTRGIIYLSIESVSIAMLIISHFRAMFTDPGSIPKNKDWEIPSDDNSESSDSVTKKLLEKTKKGFTRSCGRCQHKKPDRTHHCRQCDRCNLKMDHHCNWIANCVGYFNYKYFFLIVFYGAIALGLFVGTFWECVVVTLNDSTNSTLHCFIVTLIYSLISMLGVVIIGFCIFHLWLIYNNYTTIEYCEKKRKDVPGYTKSPFSLESKYQNFQEALGSNPLLWFIPVNSRDPDGGLYFK